MILHVVIFSWSTSLTLNDFSCYKIHFWVGERFYEKFEAKNEILLPFIFTPFSRLFTETETSLLLTHPSSTLILSFFLFPFLWFCLSSYSFVNFSQIFPPFPPGAKIGKSSPISLLLRACWCFLATPPLLPILFWFSVLFYFSFIFALKIFLQFPVTATINYLTILTVKQSYTFSQ